MSDVPPPQFPPPQPGSDITRHIEDTAATSWPRKLLTDSATLGIIGGIAGTSIGIGILIVLAVATTRDWTTTLDPLLTLPVPLIGLAAGLLAGAQPAWKAIRIPRVEALRS